MKKKQNRNRLLSLVLSLVMILQMLPVSVLAADATSGACGPNLTWRIDGDTLFIEGEGAMYDYGDVYDDEGNWVEFISAPWSGAAYSHAELDDRITHIGDYAFQENTMETIEFPAGLKSIGDYAFAYCEKLKEVSLPEGLETMGYRVFNVCHSLETITIPSTLKVIPNSAFWECKHLENVTIAEGVEEIESNAFADCCDIYNSDYTSLNEMPGLQHIEIPGSVKKIGDYAFANNVKLTELVLHEGLEEIGGTAFYMCNFLREVTIPSTVQTVGFDAFVIGPVDLPFLYNTPIMQENPQGLMNLYVLSKDLSLYSIDMEGEGKLWMMGSTTIHAYEGSKMAEEIEAYNAEIPEEGLEADFDENGNWADAKYRIPFYPLIDGAHDFSDRTSVDEENHSRSCADCDVEEVRPHTLVIDMDTWVAQSCETDGAYRWICSACDYAGDFIYDEAVGHNLSTSYDKFDDGHEAYCYNCYKYIRVPHEWSYEADLTATEPYDVEATCAVCGYTKTITIVPEGATYVSVKAEDEIGDDVALPENAFAVLWKDSEGNTLGEGTSYVHTQDWKVTEDTPVIAVLTFSDEIRAAYSVTEKVEHTVTQLGEVAEYRLVPRDTLTVTGKVTPLLSDMTVALTTVLAGTESTMELEPNRDGVFTTEIRRTSAVLTISALGYDTVQLENIQMMPAVDGVIDLGTIEVGDRFATEYVTVEYTDDYSKAIAQNLVKKGAQVTLVGADGTECHGATIRKYPGQTDEGGYKFRILLSRDVSDYFEIGEQVTLSYLDKNDCAILPYTFTIARDGEQQTLDLELEKALELSILLSKLANLYVFDENDAVVYGGRGAGETLTLPKGTYTVVAYAYNSYISGIDSPDMLERAGAPSAVYVKETIELTADTVKEYSIPDFVMPSEIGFSVTVGENLRVGDLIPIYITYADKHDNGLAETVGLQLEFIQVSDMDEFPLVEVNGQYAFGERKLQLTEVFDKDPSFVLYDADRLTVTTHQPEGTITLYAKATGGQMMVRGTGNRGYTTIDLPRNSVELFVPETMAEPEGELYIYTMLPSNKSPYTAKLYVDGALCSTTQSLNIWGNGENALPYEMEQYPDGTSVHMVQVEVLDEDQEIVWSSPSHMVMLTDEENYVEPQKLALRMEHAGDNTETWWDLNKLDYTSYLTMYFPNLNEDNTVSKEIVFDYRLTMSNPEKVKNGTVYMKIFCSENAPSPTITRIPLYFNPETQTFDGTFVLEANTYTEDDLPYGYSFEYATLTDTEFSVQQTIDKAEQQAEAMMGSVTVNPFDYYDPDETEFMLQNAAELSEEDREMIRTLLSIENDLHDLRAESDSSAQALAAELFGDSAASSDPLESLTTLMGAVSGGITCESAGGITAADLLVMGYSPITAAGQTFYIYQDEGGYLSLVDPKSDLHYAFGSSMATYSRARAADDGEGNDDFASYARVWITQVVSCTQGAISYALEITESLRNQYNKIMWKLKGLEGEAADIEHYIRMYGDRISELSNADLGKDAANSVKAAQKALDNLEEIVELNQRIDRLVTELKGVRTDLSAALANLDDLGSTVSKLRAKMIALNALGSGAFKVAAFIGIDVVNIILVTIDAFDAYETSQSRHKTITNGEKLAKNAKENMERELAAECLKDPEGAQAQYGKCLEIYEEFTDSADSAKSWNKKWFATKIEQVIGQIGSTVAGVAIKGPMGIAVGLGIGLAGTSAEAVCLHFFDYHSGWMVSHMDGVNFECVRPLPFEKDCEPEEEEPTEEIIVEKPTHPVAVKPLHKQIFDPAGYVYEAVASNRIEGATAKIYYEGENGEVIYWSDADLYGEVNPQITDMDGRFAWMTPIGNWLVKITKDGYKDADSKNAPAAEDGWLPVPPPQLDVNIALVSEAAPAVTSAAVAADQAQVVFSQYMDVEQFANGNLVAVTQNGINIPVTAVFTDAEVSPADDTVYYGRVLKLTRTDGQPFSGSSFEIGIRAEAVNYAGTAMGSAYTSGALTAAQIAGSLSHSYPNRYVTDVSDVEEIVVQVLDTAGQPMPGVAVTARQKLGGTLEMGESAVSDASGRAVFTVKGISSGYDTVIFEAGVVRTEMNTRVSPLGTTAPKKPTANLSDHAVVVSGTQLVLTCSTEGAVIYYTTDDTCPCTDSDARKIYDGPITITEDTFFRIAAWTQAGGYSERLNLHITVKAEDVHICKDHLTRVEAKPADCTVDGNIEYWSCSCGKWYSDATASVEITDKDSVVIKASHDYGTLIDEVPAVHTAAELKAGMKAHYFCDKCDTHFTAEKVQTTEAALIIPAPTHNYATVNGYKEADGHADTCSCGAHNTVAGHTPDIPTATETQDQKCSVCGYVMAIATGKSAYLVTVVGSYASITGGGEYEAGKTVTVYAGSRSGYSFNGWTSSDVAITNANSATASFVMPDHAVTVTANWTRNNSGGGGSYVPVSYTNTVAATENGDVSVSPKSAAKGETVTITIVPDKGYTLETLTVTDKNGKEIELTNKGDGKYTFTMPASKVTVKATFMEDNTMLNYFVDVFATDYYYDAVLWTVGEGITNGTSATTFSPGAVCTRAQMATFLWRAAGSPDPVGNSNPFADVSEDTYYAKAVQWAYEQGITGGTSATTYSPDAPCTRGQMVAFLHRVAGTLKPEGSTNPFTDVPDTYYTEAVQWAYEQGITSGTSATAFSPDEICTRGQIVTFIWRALAE